MLKYMLIVMSIFVVMGFSAESSYGQWQGVVVRTVGKQIGKVAGKKVVNRGAEMKCLLGPFLCAKVANAPGPVQPRGPQVQPRGPQRRRN